MDNDELQILKILQKHKYNIVVCEIYNPCLHGMSTNKNIYGHYLCKHISTNGSIFIENYEEDEDAEDDEGNINEIICSCNYMYKKISRLLNIKHEFIRNYKNIISKKNYIQPHIAEIVCLPEGECVVILKTFWIRIIQRVWKRVFNQRKNIMIQRKNPNCQKIKELTGNYPINYRYLPSINGMFWL